MLQVHFTSQLRRFLDTPDCAVEAGTARQALELVFAENPRLRGYVVDERGAVRQHVAIFLSGKLVRDAAELDRELADGSEISVMQALSGG
jgi:molybdopterin converting factor small subunit